MSENHGYRYNVNKLMLEFPYYVNEFIKSKDTVALNRTIAAIKSLYNYLCEQTEDIHGNTYMTRNVSRLIHIRKKSETLHYRAAQIEGKLFLGDETKAFLEFVEHDYEQSVSNRAKSSFKKNKVRNLAILSLFYHLDYVVLNL